MPSAESLQRAQMLLREADEGTHVLPESWQQMFSWPVQLLVSFDRLLSSR